MISGATRLAGVIGDPVRHSLSPAIHNAAYAATGLDWVYLALPVGEERLGEALSGMVALGIDGLSVTMPHKARAAEYCDELTPAAEALGVVNSLRRQGARLVGHNTDGSGFVTALANNGWSSSIRSAVVVGAGGTARAITHALGAAGAHRVTVAARRARAGDSVAALAGPAGEARPLGEMGAHQWREADLVVNTTPVGMAGSALPNGSLVPVELLRSDAVVADVVYHPRVTPMLSAAAAAGHRCLGGVDLLLGLSAEVFTWWTGQAAPLEAMRGAVLAQLDGSGG
ncbi:MAG: shikimate dehydrogenase [Microthrixaceae bacterium]